MKFHHVGITVKSIKQSVAWYTTQFNCKTEYMDDTWAMLQFPKGGYLALVTDKRSRDQAGPCVHLVKSGCNSYRHSAITDWVLPWPPE